MVEILGYMTAIAVLAMLKSVNSLTLVTFGVFALLRLNRRPLLRWLSIAPLFLGAMWFADQMGFSDMACVFAALLVAAWGGFCLYLRMRGELTAQTVLRYASEAFAFLRRQIRGLMSPDGRKLSDDGERSEKELGE